MREFVAFYPGRDKVVSYPEQDLIPSYHFIASYPNVGASHLEWDFIASCPGRYSVTAERARLGENIVRNSMHSSPGTSRMIILMMMTIMVMMMMTMTMMMMLSTHPGASSEIILDTSSSSQCDRRILRSMPRKNFTGHCCRWLALSSVLSAVTSDNCVIPMTMTMTIQWQLCVGQIPISSAPTANLRAFQTSPGSFFQSWKVPTELPLIAAV